MEHDDRGAAPGQDRSNAAPGEERPGAVSGQERSGAVGREERSGAAAEDAPGARGAAAADGTDPDEAGGRPWQMAVVGAGSWGTALALHAARAGHRVTLWARRPELAREIEASRVNDEYLPGHRLPDGVEVTADGSAALENAELVLSAVPSRHLRKVWEGLAPAFPAGADLVSATKGLERGSGRRMTEVLAGHVGDRTRALAALSGPSFARELAEERPTAVTLGCEDHDGGIRLQRCLSHGPLRVYRNRDLVGVEHAGALKNVIALAAGIVDGLGLGTNARAALITRGLKEMAVLTAARGGSRRTLMGLAGLGDLVLTCTGPLSRNRKVGEELGRGRRLEEIVGSMRMVAEGVETVDAALELARSLDVAMPITEQVHAVLRKGRRPVDAIDELMARQLVEE